MKAIITEWKKTGVEEEIEDINKANTLLDLYNNKADANYMFTIQIQH